jgi:riboflavin transporter FmnP
MDERRRVSKKVKWLAKAGILSAVAIVLMYLEFPIPLMPDFLKFDFSEVPVLLAAFSMGPLSAIAIEFVKNLAHLPFTMTGGVGELANFLVGACFVGTAGWVYRIHKSRKGALAALGFGTLALIAGGVVINYFITLPFYIKVMEFPLDAIIGMVTEAGNTIVDGMFTLLLFVFVPFNLFKGLIVSLVVYLLYKRLSPLLHK